MKTNKREVTKGQSRCWLIPTEIRAISECLIKNRNKELYPIFRLLLETGLKYSKLAKLNWDSFNLRLGQVTIGKHKVLLSESASKSLMKIRELARSENQKVILIPYRSFWSRLEKICVRLGIEQTGVLTLRNTFAYIHWITYQDKQKLLSDLQIKNGRHLPSAIFQSRQRPLFQEVRL